MKAVRQRAALYRAVRSFFDARGYLEVETPQLLPCIIPESAIEPIKVGNLFLQASPEQAMKRLLAQGQRAIFQVCKCFRAQERGRLHLPEFTMLEWYRLDDDYRGLMEETQQLLHWLADQLIEEHGFSDEALAYCRQKDWAFMTVDQAFANYSPISLAEALTKGVFDERLVKDVEPQLGLHSPCFLYDYPVEMASLARPKANDSTRAERFELYLQGVEVANGFSELTDPALQRLRFLEELAAMDEAEQYLPERFLLDLANIDEACGIALGLDRLLMFLTGAERIDQVVSFTPEEL